MRRLGLPPRGVAIKSLTEFRLEHREGRHWSAIFRRDAAATVPIIRKMVKAMS
jgi:hypothetical protein